MAPFCFRAPYARVSSYVQELREANQQVVLLDGGDILQGQPTAYYYNFIDTISPHLWEAIQLHGVRCHYRWQS